MLVQIPPLSWLFERKGGSTLKTVDPTALKYLDAGRIESKNLMEGLAMDCSLVSVFGIPVADTRTKLQHLKATGKTCAVISLLAAHDSCWPVMARSHASDTVRRWACYGLSSRAGSFKDALRALKPLADDANSGLREWSWMAMRHWVIQDPVGTITLLQASWAKDPSPSLRRFCAEVTRPRGV